MDTGSQTCTGELYVRQGGESSQGCSGRGLEWCLGLEGRKMGRTSQILMPDAGSQRKLSSCPALGTSKTKQTNKKQHSNRDIRTKWCHGQQKGTKIVTMMVTLLS